VGFGKKVMPQFTLGVKAEKENNFFNLPLYGPWSRPQGQKKKIKDIYKQTWEANFQLWGPMLL
jgi:hypothetical protein